MILIRINLDVKCINIPIAVCGVCNTNMEDVVHVFITREVATKLSGLVGGWCNISVFGFSMLEEVMQCIDSIPGFINEMYGFGRYNNDDVVDHWTFWDSIMFSDPTVTRNSSINSWLIIHIIDLCLIIGR